MFVLMGLALAAPCVTHGVAIGQVTATSATVWARLAGPGEVRVDAWPADAPATRRTTLHAAPVAVDPALDHTARVSLTSLQPGTAYALRVHASGDCPAVDARFRTAPAPADPAPVRLAWGGDLGGQNTCRHASEEYPILEHVAARTPDLFVALGDMVYADDHCADRARYGYPQVVGPEKATRQADFFDWWAYNRASPSVQRLYAATALLPVWDDHEATNDAGPGNTELAPARVALDAWNPLVAGAPLPHAARWGRHVELFVLDTRSFREPNPAPDTGPAPKSMLGPAQREWLTEAVSRSDATWKVVVSSVPLAIPTGRPDARDGWSDLGGETGYEREARGILEALHAQGVQNLVFLTTDVHFAAAFTHRPIAADPGWEVYEAVSGPLQAGLFPNPKFDTTLGTERWFFHGPASIDAVKTWEEAKKWFNVGWLEVDGAGALTLSWTDASGQPLASRRFTPR